MMHHVWTVPRHRVMTMIGQLCVKPLVQGCDQTGLICPVGDFATVGQVAVVDCQLARLRRTKRRQAGHVLAVDVLRSLEITRGELLGDHGQMLANQRNLFRIVMLGHDLLNAAVRRLSKDVRSRREGKWHDVRPALRDLLRGKPRET